MANLPKFGHHQGHRWGTLLGQGWLMIHPPLGHGAGHEVGRTGQLDARE